MILHTHIPFDVETPRPLPGIAPFDPVDWLDIDETYADQMAERTRLLADRETDVLQCDDGARAAACELLHLVLDTLHRDHPEFDVRSDMVTTPDQRDVPVDRNHPLNTLAQLIQEDLCLLQKHGDEYVLTGALLCFPASWTLSEKFLRPLTDIHAPVDAYDQNIARRVQRLFDGVRVGRPLWRFNAMKYQSPALYHPRSITDPRQQDHPEQAPFTRIERQCILRLPNSGAVVFSIHTYLVKN